MQKLWMVTAISFMFNTASAFAWNNEGHMIVAAIAYQKLSPAARQKVAALLKLNPNYDQWVSSVPDSDKDQVAFLMAATWPDAIKRMTGYKNDGEHPTGSNAGQNIGYKDTLQHRYWHFIDMPFSPDGTPTKPPDSVNAETQIALFRKALASSAASDDLKSYDLVWLLHLVGDVHQPLHATSRFDKDQPNGDQGGNLVSICAAPCKSELHAFWDDVLGTTNDPVAAEKKAAAIRMAGDQQASIADESKWIDESFQAAQTSVYVDPIGVGTGPFIPTSKYRSAARALAAKRVALAGARLANLIDTALK